MKKNLKIGFVMNQRLRDNSAVSRAMERKSAEFAEYCVTVIPKNYCEGNPAELLRVLEELREEGVSGIALTPTSDPEVEEKINALIHEEIAVVTYEHDLPNTGRLAYVGCDYYCNGRTIAGAIRMVLGVGERWVSSLEAWRPRRTVRELRASTTVWPRPARKSRWSAEWSARRMM